MKSMILTMAGQSRTSSYAGSAELLSERLYGVDILLKMLEEKCGGKS